MDLDEIIRSELRPGERLLWSGRPVQGVLLRPTDSWVIPFSLIWGGFAFFWEWSVISTGAPLTMALFGIPFVLMGIYLILGRFTFDAWSRGRMIYAVTPERAILVSGLGRTVQSIPLKPPIPVGLREGKNGVGTITLGGDAPPIGFGKWPAGIFPWSVRPSMPTIDLVEDAREVYRLIQSTQRPT